MSFAFFSVAIFMTIAAVALVLTPLLRERFKTEDRLGEWRLELKSLVESNAAGSLDPVHYAAQRAAIGDALLEYIGSEPRHAAPTAYVALAVAILMLLSAFCGYKWVAGTRESHAQRSVAVAAMPVDHGADMQAAIARRADELRQKPDDAQGWALLGRTYKATQHYPEARDAFEHAFDAAPATRADTVQVTIDRTVE